MSNIKGLYKEYQAINSVKHSDSNCIFSASLNNFRNTYDQIHIDSKYYTKLITGSLFEKYFALRVLDIVSSKESAEIELPIVIDTISGIINHFRFSDHVMDNLTRIFGYNLVAKTLLDKINQYFYHEYLLLTYLYILRKATRHDNYDFKARKIKSRASFIWTGSAYNVKFTRLSSKDNLYVKQQNDINARQVVLVEKILSEYKNNVAIKREANFQVLYV